MTEKRTCPVRRDFDPLGRRYQEDPYEVLAGLPRDEPVFYSPVLDCLGAALGKLEAQLALEELIARFPGLRLVPAQTLAFHPNISFRGPQQLWVIDD